MIIVYVLSALNSTAEVRVLNGAALVRGPEQNKRTSLPMDRTADSLGKLLATNQAGRICRGSDRGSGLVPG